MPQTIQKEIRESIRATHVAEETETYQKNAASIMQNCQRKSVRK